MALSIRDLSAGDRPRERLWAAGARALSEAELVALVIGSGRPGESALDLARSLLADLGGLRGVGSASPEELAGRPGLGPARVASLCAALELARRGGNEPVAIIKRADDLAAIAMEELRDLRRERVIAIVLGPGNRLRRVVTVAEGSAVRSQLPVREILNAVLRNDGVAFGVAHNHPSGDPSPSRIDIEATERLGRAARSVDLRLLDHIIVAGNDWRSIPPSSDLRNARSTPPESGS